MTNRTSQLSENALMLGVAGVLLLLSVYTFFGVLTLFFLPVPFVLLASKRTLRDMVVVLIAYALLSLILAREAGLLLSLQPVLTGVVMGMLYRRYGRALPAIVGGAATVFLILVASIAFSVFVLNLDLMQEFEQAKKSWLDNMPLPLTGGLSPEEWKRQVELITDSLVMLFPLMLVNVSFFTSWLTHVLSRLVAKRTRHPLPALPPFREWSFPRSLLVYYFAAFVVMLLFGQELREGFWLSALTNGKALLDILFIIQGLSFCVYMAYQKGWSFIQPVLFVLVFLFPPVASILSLLGIVDIGFELRKRIEIRKG